MSPIELKQKPVVPPVVVESSFGNEGVIANGNGNGTVNTTNGNGSVAAPATNTTTANTTTTTNGNGQDRRITRSKKALRDALVSLIEERGIYGFTINDLCTKADLNRGTFYNHFQDIPDFISRLETDFMLGLDDYQTQMSNLTLRNLAKVRLHKKPLPFLVGLFDYLRQEGDLLHALLGPGGDARFSLALRDSVCMNLVHSILNERYRENPEPFVNYYVAYFTSAYLGVIQRWIETGMQESSEEMARIAVRLLFIKPGERIKL